jgi:hypothetical protein
VTSASTTCDPVSTPVTTSKPANSCQIVPLWAAPATQSPVEGRVLTPLQRETRFRPSLPYSFLPVFRRNYERIRRGSATDGGQRPTCAAKSATESLGAGLRLSFSEAEAALDEPVLARINHVLMPPLGIRPSADEPRHELAIPSIQARLAGSPCRNDHAVVFEVLRRPY